MDTDPIAALEAPIELIRIFALQSAIPWETELDLFKSAQQKYQIALSKAQALHSALGQYPELSHESAPWEVSVLKTGPARELVSKACEAAIEQAGKATTGDKGTAYDAARKLLEKAIETGRKTLGAAHELMEKRRKAIEDLGKARSEVAGLVVRVRYERAQLDSKHKAFRERWPEDLLTGSFSRESLQKSVQQTDSVAEERLVKGDAAHDEPKLSVVRDTARHLGLSLSGLEDQQDHVADVHKRYLEKWKEREKAVSKLKAGTDALAGSELIALRGKIADKLDGPTDLSVDATAGFRGELDVIWRALVGDPGGQHKIATAKLEYLASRVDDAVRVAEKELHELRLKVEAYRNLLVGLSEVAPPSECLPEHERLNQLQLWTGARDKTALDKVFEKWMSDIRDALNEHSKHQVIWNKLDREALLVKARGQETLASEAFVHDPAGLVRELEELPKQLTGQLMTYETACRNFAGVQGRVEANDKRKAITVPPEAIAGVLEAEKKAATQVSLLDAAVLEKAKALAAKASGGKVTADEVVLGATEWAGDLEKVRTSWKKELDTGPKTIGIEDAGKVAAWKETLHVEAFINDYTEIAKRAAARIEAVSGDTLDGQAQVVRALWQSFANAFADEFDVVSRLADHIEVLESDPARVAPHRARLGQLDQSRKDELTNAPPSIAVFKGLSVKLAAIKSELEGHKKRLEGSVVTLRSQAVILIEMIRSTFLKIEARAVDAPFYALWQDDKSDYKKYVEALRQRLTSLAGLAGSSFPGALQQVVDDLKKLGEQTVAALEGVNNVGKDGKSPLLEHATEEVLSLQSAIRHDKVLGKRRPGAHKELLQTAVDLEGSVATQPIDVTESERKALLKDYVEQSRGARDDEKAAALLTEQLTALKDKLELEGSAGYKQFFFAKALKKGVFTHSKVDLDDHKPVWDKLLKEIASLLSQVDLEGQLASVRTGLAFLIERVDRYVDEKKHPHALLNATVKILEDEQRVKELVASLKAQLKVFASETVPKLKDTLVTDKSARISEIEKLVKEGKAALDKSDTTTAEQKLGFARARAHFFLTYPEGMALTAAKNLEEVRGRYISAVKAYDGGLTATRKFFESIDTDDEKIRTALVGTVTALENMFALDAFDRDIATIRDTTKSRDVRAAARESALRRVSEYLARIGASYRLKALAAHPFKGLAAFDHHRVVAKRLQDLQRNLAISVDMTKSK